MARDAYAEGMRNFLAVGGDGTSYEIVNGLFPEALKNDAGEKPTLGFLPVGTGNSFLRDFTTQGVEHTIASLKAGKRRSCDVIRLTHAGGDIYYMNLLSLGFPADVGETANRRFKGMGELGYIRAVFAHVANLEHRGFAHKVDGAGGVGSRSGAFPHVQQQQVYRRENDDRAEGRSVRRSDRVRALGADRARWACGDSAAAFHRHAHPASSGAACGGEARGVSAGWAGERDDRWRKSATRVPVASKMLPGAMDIVA